MTDMRQKLTSLIALASFALAGCSQSTIEAPNEPGPVKDTVSTDFIIEDSDLITWETDDAVSIISSSDSKANSRFVVESKEGTTARLTGKMIKGNALCAVYPYDENSCMNVDGQMYLISSYLPAEQTESGISDIFVAVENEGALSFYPSAAKVRITVKSDGSDEEVASVSLSGNNDESLSGPVQIMAFPKGQPVMMAPAAGGTDVTITGTWTVTDAQPLTVDLSVAPALLSNGYTISVTKADGITSVKKYDTSISLASTKTTELEEFVFEGPKFWFEYTADKKLDVAGYKNDYDSATGKGKLWFATETIPESILDGNKEIKGVHIPAFITEVGAGAFKGCSSLSSLTFEEGSSLKIIRTTAFQKTALVRIDFPASLTAVEVQGFQGTNNLRGITFPADSRLERLEQGAFNGTTVMDDITLPASVKFLDRCFNNKYVPKINATILATTPPELGNGGKGVFNENGLNKIYVPAASLEAYKAAWTTYTKYFVAIP